VKNSVISNSCEGFVGANRSASTVARDNGPNVARFLVNQWAQLTVWTITGTDDGQITRS
jgi:hypothetical protein